MYDLKRHGHDFGKKLLFDFNVYNAIVRHFFTGTHFEC